MLGEIERDRGGERGGVHKPQFGGDDADLENNDGVTLDYIHGEREEGGRGRRQLWRERESNSIPKDMFILIGKS